MNIQVRKLNLIENLIFLQDETIISKMEKLLFPAVHKKEVVNLKPMSIEEFYARIDASEKALKEGKFISQKELEKESQNW